MNLALTPNAANEVSIAVAFRLILVMTKKRESKSKILQTNQRSDK